MWKSIYAAQRFNTGYSYTVRTRTKVTGGKTRMADGTTYSNLVLSFTPERKGPKWTGDGYQIRSFAQAVVPCKFFTDNSFLPTIDDLIKGENGERYRIIGIEDYSDKPHMGVYYFEMKRDEYAV